MGYDISRYDSLSNRLARRAKLLSTYEISLVLDVGANEGWYAIELRETGYKGRIFSYEPLSRAYEKLAKHSRRDENWKTFNVALGNEDGTSMINIAGNSESSSFLNMLPTHIEAAPDSNYVGKEEVAMRRLDSVFGELGISNENVYLKIDSQGYEKTILEGAKNSLERIDTIQVELSIVPLYEGQPVFLDMVPFFTESGYKLVCIEPTFPHPVTGELLQADVTFHRFR